MKTFSRLVLAIALFCAAAAQANSLKEGLPAPEIGGIEQWLNSEPLTLHQLRGKVVLVDFWTYSCINCIHTLPYVKRWYDKYRNKGLVVIGVHTPEYPEERSTGNVMAAMKRFDIQYPVAQDNNYVTWSAYRNRYWPAMYLINKKGQVVYLNYGEGRYEDTEAAIRTLLAEPN